MEKQTAKAWVKKLHLEPHIEGGYFRKIYESEQVAKNIEGAEQKTYTSIYFLLEHLNSSHFHRLTVDEIWYFHAGNPLTIHMIHPNGDYETIALGIDLPDGPRLQYRVPAGVIFGSSVETTDGFSVVSCMCAPGFTYEDFELFSTKELVKDYPKHEKIIERLTRDSGNNV